MVSSTLSFGIADYNSNFVDNWNKIMEQFSTCKQDNKLWLAGPSSYLFKMSGIKFGVDLQIRRDCDFDAVCENLSRDLGCLDAVLITHQHGDHMCPKLINKLKNSDIVWYIPMGTREDYIEKSGLTEDKIVWVKPNDVWKIGEVEFRAFFTPHAVGEQPFLQCGYEITSCDGKVIIPGDIRDYDYRDYPEFKNVDLCISHLWGGNDSINDEKYMPMLDKFSGICSSFNASRYFLCHLYEIGREQQKLWSFKHAGLVMDMMYSLNPKAVVEVPRIAKCYDIF